MKLTNKLKKLFIPPYVTKICEGAFSFCFKHQRIDIPSNSEIQTIEKEVFKISKISSIFIPPYVIKIFKDAFDGCYELQQIDIPSNSRLQTIEDSALCHKNINLN